MSETIGHRDPLYLFMCYVQWHHTQNVTTHQELLAAMDDDDPDIRLVAEVLLDRVSPRLEATTTNAEVR